MEKVEGFAATDFTEQDAIRAMAERCSDQVADGDGGEVGLLSPRFKSHEVRFVELDFGGVLYDDDPLLICDGCRKCV